ncbi:hypothetical protein SLE2022_013630 [Rubroshorea leprosula]
MGEEKSKEQQHSTESFAGTESSLRQAIEVISSLISLSHSIRVFTVKWKLIRDKLEQLNSGLIAIANCDSIEKAELSGLIPAILDTANQCSDLARRCLDLSYSGKLLMQSDLDVIAAKFDRHVKNLSGFHTAGILTHGFAVVVSRPGVGACKEDMRFYIRDLLTRMKIGDSEMKRQALVNLCDTVANDERCLKLIAEVGDIVYLLVSFLDSSEMEIQEEAAKIVSLIAGFDSYRSVLIRSGIIGPLIRVLESGGEMCKEAAARCLQKLTLNADNAWSVSAHGGVTALLKICSSGNFGGELIASSCGVLRNLVVVEEIKRFMVEEGAIATFIKLSRSKDESLQINSIDFLQDIASGDESVRQIVVREGGIRGLVRILDPRSPSSSKTREAALRAIESLCFSSPKCITMLLNYGFLDQVLFFLRDGGEVSIQEIALKVTFRLSGTSEEAKKTMGEAGFMPELVRLLDAKSFEVREMAIEALSALVSVQKNRKILIQDDRNISFLLQLLDQEDGNSGNKKLLLSILMSLTSCNSGRRKIAASGYLKNIEKLAEAEVSDAKRIVKKLSTNRFRSLLSGIWHF